MLLKTKLFVMIAKEGGVGVYRSKFIKLEQPSMLFVRTTSV